MKNTKKKRDGSVMDEIASTNTRGCQRLSRGASIKHLSLVLPTVQPSLFYHVRQTAFFPKRRSKFIKTSTLTKHCHVYNGSQPFVLKLRGRVQKLHQISVIAYCASNKIPTIESSLPYNLEHSSSASKFLTISKSVISEAVTTSGQAAR